MKINLRFFASVREALNTSHEWVDVPSQIQTAGQVRQWLIERGGIWAETLAPTRALRMAMNHTMCEPEQKLIENCEIAFFPPVTGG